ncbi:MAG: hypothetical protein ACFFDW_10475 [Candidatus Thorarchaeota archaeon]
MKKQKEQAKHEGPEEPQRNKALLYFAFALTAVGAVTALVPTVIIFLPITEITWQTLFQNPLTYILITGVVLVTAGLILQRVITPPMKMTETQKLKSRLE